MGARAPPEGAVPRRGRGRGLGEDHDDARQRMARRHEQHGVRARERVDVRRRAGRRGRLRGVAGRAGRGGGERLHDVRRQRLGVAGGAGRGRRRDRRHGPHPRAARADEGRGAALQPVRARGRAGGRAGLRAGRGQAARLLRASQGGGGPARRGAEGDGASDGPRRAADRRFPARGEGAGAPAGVRAAAVVDHERGASAQGRADGGDVGRRTEEGAEAPRARARLDGRLHGARVARRHVGRAGPAHARDRGRARARPGGAHRRARTGAGGAPARHPRLARGLSVEGRRAPRVLVPQRARARRRTQLGQFDQLPEEGGIQRDPRQPLLGRRGVLRLAGAARLARRGHAGRRAEGLSRRLPEVRCEVPCLEGVLEHGLAHVAGVRQPDGGHEPRAGGLRRRGEGALAMSVQPRQPAAGDRRDVRARAHGRGRHPLRLQPLSGRQPLLLRGVPHAARASSPSRARPSRTGRRRCARTRRSS